MLLEYINMAIENAEYKKLEDGTWFAEIPGFEGVWANGESVEECRRELIEVLEEWLILKIKDKDLLPAIKGIDINIETFEKYGFVVIPAKAGIQKYLILKNTGFPEQVGE